MINDSELTEYESRDLLQPIRQGDIFRWRVPDTNDPWRSFGIIITADCDLAHKKHRGYLSYCSVLPLQSFLSLFWLPIDLEKESGRAVNNMLGILTKVMAANSSEFEPIQDPEVLLGWLERRGPNGIVDDLELPHGKERDELSDALQQLALLLQVTQSSDTKLQIQVLARAQTGWRDPNSNEVVKKIANVWKNYANRLARTIPGDLFFLNSLAASLTGGFIVDLRRIGEIRHDEIAIQPMEEPQRPVFRIGRLKENYRYRLTQKLSSVFADIGLPEEYERQCEITLETVGMNLIPR